MSIICFDGSNYYSVFVEVCYATKGQFSNLIAHLAPLAKWVTDPTNAESMIWGKGEKVLNIKQGIPICETQPFLNFPWLEKS